MITKVSSAVLLLGSGFVVFRYFVRYDYLKRGKLSSATATLELIYFAVHANSMYLFIPVKWPKLPPLSANVVLHFCSLILIISGLVIVFSALLPLGYGRSMGLESQNLKITGLYKLSRNPQVIGYTIFLAGFAVSYPSIYSAGWMTIFGIVAHQMVITEEEYLIKLYGEKYEDYRENVPRYLSCSRFCIGR